MGSILEMKIEQRLLQLKQQIEEAFTAQTRVEGLLEAHQEELRVKYKVDSPKGLQQKIRQIECDIAKKEALLTKRLTHIEALLSNQNQSVQ
jgi:hypothetical protein